MAGFGDGFHIDDIIGDGGTDGFLCDIHHYDEFSDYDEDIFKDEDEVDDKEEESGEEKEPGEEEEPGEEDLSLALIPIIRPPYAVVHHGRHLCKQTFFSIPEALNAEGDEHESIRLLRRVPILIGMKCYASQHGWLLLVHQSSTRCLLLNPTSMEVVELPPIEETSTFRDTDFCVLSAPPPNCVVLFLKHIFFRFCWVGDHQWTTQRLGLSWDYRPSYDDDDRMVDYRKVDNVVSCKGKIYVSFWYGSKVMILHPTSNPTGFTVETINIVDEMRPQFQVFSKGVKRSHLVESRGDIYMVTKIYWGGNEENMAIFGVEVWKLNLLIPCWVEVEDLGGRLFFLSKGCSFSCSASETGLDDNLIFFFEPDDDCVYIYNMKDLSVTIELPWPNIGHLQTQPYWMMAPLNDVVAELNIDAAVLDEVLDGVARIAVDNEAAIDAAVAAVEDKVGNS